MKNIEQKEVEFIELLTGMKDSALHAMNQILEAKESFTKTHEIELSKLPYNINLLDEIHANENTHSRILAKLLKYSFNKEYILLSEFLLFLGPPFSDLQLCNSSFALQ